MRARLALAALVLASLTAAPVRAQEATPPTGDAEATGTTGTTTESDTPTADGGAGATTEATPTPTPSLRVVVIDAATYGIAPIVGAVTTDVMRRTAAEMGYGVVDAQATIAMAQRARMPYPPTPADLWRTTVAGGAHRGVFARVWAESGRYVIEVMVASADGAGPYFGRDTAGADDLRDVARHLIEAALPPPTQWNPAGVPQAQPSAIAPTVGPTAVPPRRGARQELAHPLGRDGRRWRRPEPELRRFSLSLQTEGSIGTTSGSFYNHFAGGRFDVRITRDFMVGAYLAYVNLEGRAQRVSNFYFAIEGEYRVRPSSSLDLTIPIRLSVGYLPLNGPVGRLSAGLNYAFDEHWEIGADLLVPTFYFLPAQGRVAVAFDFALDVGYRF